MKTVDLIPLILLELNECDKYGFELTKNIENKSNGKIIIKQPTLYTLLKKLEKSKFIASYWQDSDIGGKRHYYKLTENGKMQVSTLPAYDFLLKNALSEEDDDENEDNPQLNSTIATATEEKPSIMDELLNQPSAPTETILPTEEVFADNSIDNSTEMEINLSNIEMLKTENISQDEQFATNTNVMKFTEKVVTSLPETQKDNQSTNSYSNTILDVEFSIPKSEKQIEYVDYIDLKNNDKYKYSKKISKKLVLQALTTSGSLIVMLIICSIATFFSARSTLYYFFFIASILTALFYPIIMISNSEQLRLKYQEKRYETNTKLKLYVGMTITIVIVLLCVLINVCTGNNTISLMLSIENFENFYAPILFTSVFYLDVLFNHLFLSKQK